LKAAALIASMVAFQPAVAAAQAVGTRLSVSAATDLRERGLSLSDGKAAAQIRLTSGLGRGLIADVGVATARNSPRFGGSDFVIDAGTAYRIEAAAFFADAGIYGRAFPGGRHGQAYGELYGAAGVRLALAEFDLSFAYAPDQSAIGGDNRYVRLRTRVALVGSPVTITAHVGRTSGDVDDPARAARLRPSGRYTDWRVAADYVLGPTTLGIAYTDTDATSAPARFPLADNNDAGARLIARIAYDF
jgi:uncharacterized protein (TIGR02001 family)